MLGQMLKNVREKTPLIHNITNYVTVNDCANILLACGGSPIMSDDIEDAAQITAICGGLNINIGTLNQNTIKAMFAAGKRANELGHITILDPVGAGASELRTQTAQNLISELKFTAIKGNISEIKTLMMGTGKTKGVDADIADTVNENNINEVITAANKFSEQTGAVIMITGAVDIVANSANAYIIKNGCEMMSRITGAGCMLSSLTAAYLTANPDNLLEAAAAAVCAMGICGERAEKRMGKKDGNSSYRNYLIDEMYNLNEKILNKQAKFKYC